MGKSGLPHYKKKQAQLFAKDVKPEELRRLGKRFAKAGWISDAIVFMNKAGDNEGLSQIRKQMVLEGDAFLFKHCLLALDAEATNVEWKELGDAALGMGKLQFAREAYRLAGERKSMDAVDEMINPKEEVIEAQFEDDDANGTTDST